MRELKSILQKQVREEDCDGKGTQDAFELGFDFDRAIEALEKLLHNGWKVIMCNRIGDDLEYILEKEENRDES